MRKVSLLRHVSKPGSEKAFKFLRPVKREELWIPHSVMTHVSQIGLPDADGIALVVVEVEDWFAEKEDL